MREHIFKRHATSTKLVRNLGLSESAFRKKLKIVQAEGMWAYVEVPEDDDPDGEICVIHFWHRKDQDPRMVAYMLGHELGHIADGGPKFAPGDEREEDRADEFARATQESLAVLITLGLLSGPSGTVLSARGPGPTGRLRRVPDSVQHGRGARAPSPQAHRG